MIPDFSLLLSQHLILAFGNLLLAYLSFYLQVLLVLKSGLEMKMKNRRKFKSINYLIKTFRSYMHANDMCRWLLKIVKNSSIKCPIYNLGSDKKID